MVRGWASIVLPSAFTSLKYYYIFILSNVEVLILKANLKIVLKFAVYLC